MVQIHDLQPKNSKDKKKRVGRGGRRGKTSGRGHKGQKARAGGTPRPQIRDRIKKIPKKRGYRFNSIQDKPQVVNVGALEGVVKKGESVTPDRLVEFGFARKKGGSVGRVKILGGGSIDTAITVSGVEVSESARKKIEEAGGTIR